MRIGIYIGSAHPESGGAYTFQKDIIDSLKQYSGVHDYFVFTNYDGTFNFDHDIKVITIKLKKYQKIYYKFLSLISRIQTILFRKRVMRQTNLMRLMRKYEIDIAWFMSSTFEDPGIPYIFTIWDLAHKYFPFLPEITKEGWEFKEREAFYSNAVAKAALIITGTSLGRNDIVNFFNVPHERIHIIPFPTPKYTLDFQNKNIEDSFFNNSRDFIFYPAQFWPHKNHIIILKTLKFLKQKFGKIIDAVFTGSDKGNLEFIKHQTAQLEIEDQVHFLGFVTREQLVDLYKHAEMLVFPTYFGPDNLPPLEAFSLGCPVIASDISGAREQLGDNALFFNPNDEEELANCILSILDNSKLKNDLIEKGIKRAKSWTSVDYTVKILQRIDELQSLIGLWKDVGRKGIRVLHINTSDTIGGASQVAYDLIHSMDADCTLAVFKKESKSNKVIELPQSYLDKVFLTIDKVFWKLGYKKSLKSILSISDQLNFTYNKLKKMKEYEEADIVHLHNIHGNYFDLSAIKKIASEKKIVWTLHDMWAMTGGEAYIFKDDNYKKGIGNTPYLNVYPLQNPVIDRRQHFMEVKKRMYEDIGSKLTVVSVSHWLENCFNSAYVCNKQMQVKLIYNGINLEVFKNYRQRNWVKPRLLFFNIESTFKGSSLFLDILTRINEEYELIVVGDKLKSDIKHKYIEYTFNREYLNEIYNSADLLVFPSLAESFGLTVLEGLVCGVCVIASNAGGIPEILDDSSGYLFQSGDKEDLLNKIKYALKNLAESRLKADIASNHVEKFSREKSSDHYLALYRQILSIDSEESTANEIEEVNAKTNKHDFINN